MSRRIGQATWWRRRFLVPIAALALTVTVLVFGDPIPMTIDDFHLSGTQIGDVNIEAITESTNCSLCHGAFDPPNVPFDTWKGSLMANAGLDPLFFAQMATANQDVANVGY